MKVLIISYSAMTLSTNGGKRLCSLFSSFSEDELIQLYVSPHLPDKKRCKSYFQLTDSDIVKHVDKNRKGRILDDLSFECDNDRKELLITKNKSKHRHMKLLLRDLAWNIIPWFSSMLKEWIEKEKPDIIFSDTGDSCFLYNITLKISKEYKLPVVCGFGDDYYSIPLNYKNPFALLQCTMLKRKIKDFVKYCKYVVTVNTMFTDMYASTFNIYNKIHTIFMGNSLDFTNENIDINKKNNLSLSFIGNQTLGRWENLIQIAKVIESYNMENNTEHLLYIYGNNVSEFEYEAKNIHSIVFKGFIPGNQVKEAILKSDILIHTESFKECNIKKTKYSLSTKIADSLKSGKLLLAYGPENIASMKHLIENECAYTIIKEDALKDKIYYLLDNQCIFHDIVENEIETAAKFHDAFNDSLFLKDIMKRCI